MQARDRDRIRIVAIGPHNVNGAFTRDVMQAAPRIEASTQRPWGSCKALLRGVPVRSVNKAGRTAVRLDRLDPQRARSRAYRASGPPRRRSVSVTDRLIPLR